MESDITQPQTRRGFLDWIVGLFATVMGAAMAVPSLMYLWPAAKGGGVDKVEVEGASKLSPGQASVIQFGSQVVIVVRDRVGFKAFSAVCTHLGCLVEWDSSRKEFLCPCHAATFDDNGEVVSGPPPAPLPKFTVREIGDKVYVSAA